MEVRPATPCERGSHEAIVVDSGAYAQANPTADTQDYNMPPACTSHKGDVRQRRSYDTAYEPEPNIVLAPLSS